VDLTLEDLCKQLRLSGVYSYVQEYSPNNDNLQKFLRIQIANLFMFILAFLGSSIFAIAGTALFTPGQVLWIHMLIVAPIGAALGLDIASPGIMNRKPRRFDDSLISTRMYVRLFGIGIFMAASTLVMFQIGQVTYGSSQIGQTMGLVSLSIMNIFVALNLRFPYESAFHFSTFSNRRLVYSYLWVIFGTVLITETRLFQTMFHTVGLTGDQWILCLIPGIVLLMVGEIFKKVLKVQKEMNNT